MFSIYLLLETGESILFCFNKSQFQDDYRSLPPSDCNDFDDA